ncbi:hypothetical protein FH966_09730 [Lentibacillus cibarius]|uniref:Uncharacterized protein n=1 Tax=Lentibacillus cibarius TaxID=2583219 RepID=A0A549YJ77_9BACI|nr:hypothetical protein [Lentibacillus cibarius]TRM11943.1 hypothetical protein FH966_09730 [Lentibacillus cibarius]
MSDHKKVIHVKDLVIKADNVYIEPSRPRRDPFFRPRVTEEYDAGKKSTDTKHLHHDENPDDRDDDHGDRRRFSWI